MDREGQSAASAVLDLDAEAAQSLQHLVHRPQPGVRVAVEPHRTVGQARQRRDEPHDRPGQTAVHRAPTAKGPGADLPVLARDVDLGTQSGQRVGHQQGVTGAEGATHHARPVGEGRQHQRPVGHRLGPGQPHNGTDRPPGKGSRPEFLH